MAQPHVSFRITGGRLILSANASMRQELRRRFPDENCSDQELVDILEHLTCNSELDWVLPEYTGDLTDAPMLGIYGEPQTESAGRLAGCWPDARGKLQTWFLPVLQRWAYMDYQVRCVIQDLIQSGQAVFVEG